MALMGFAFPAHPRPAIGWPGLEGVQPPGPLCGLPEGLDKALAIFVVLEDRLAALPAASGILFCEA